MEKKLARIAQTFKSGRRLTDSEFDSLLHLASSRRPEIREAALVMLVHPPVDDELDHYRWLLSKLNERTPKINKLPTELWELLLEIICFLNLPFPCAVRENIFSRALRHPPKRALHHLLQKPLSLSPILPHMAPKIFEPKIFRSRFSMKRNWRLFRKRVVRQGPSSGWDQPTFRDLHAIWRQCRLNRTYPVRRLRKGRWLRMARSLFFEPWQADPENQRAYFLSVEKSGRSPLAHLRLSRSTWNGFGELSLRYLETLSEWQAEELRAVRRLAKDVSKSTGRVVLSLHNATLGAMGGWAFESLHRQFSSERLWQEFCDAVLSDLAERKERVHDERNLQILDLWALWEKRLVVPKIQQALWDAVARSRLDPRGSSRREGEYEIFKKLLPEKAVYEVMEGRKFSWQGALSPHQRSSLHEIVSWRSTKRKTWKSGMIRLSAILQAAQKFLDEGRLSSFVVPWIDKFFISSKRDEDSEYLPALIDWIGRHGVPPLVLFWEDTSRRRLPSFQVALKKIAEVARFRGIGLFDWQGTDRSDALEIILKNHSQVRLFALRPWTDNHYGVSLYQLLENLDYQFFKSYDSAWKDNLSFIYAGTQVRPFLSIECEREPFSPWLAAAGKKYPFGMAFRNELRRITLGQNRAMDDFFSWAYACWANLC